MNDTEKLYEGLIIMVIGVGAVLTFLCTMIVSMKIMSKVVGYLNEIFPEPVKDFVQAKSVPNSENEIALAILSAFLKKH